MTHLETFLSMLPNIVNAIKRDSKNKIYLSFISAHWIPIFHVNPTISEKGQVGNIWQIF